MFSPVYSSLLSIATAGAVLIVALGLGHRRPAGAKDRGGASASSIQGLIGELRAERDEARRADLLDRLAMEARTGSTHSATFSRWRLVALACVAAILAPLLAGQAAVSIVAPEQSIAASDFWSRSSDAEIGDAYRRLSDFIERGEVGGADIAMSKAGSEQGATLPDVDTMIGRLAARLEKEPGDAEGWRMLGWSYHQTGRDPQAIDAYRKALALLPGDPDIERAIAEAGGGSAAHDSEERETASMSAVADGTADRLGGNAQMIRDMVDGLDRRLAESPKDEQGWIKLMRSRMVLGEAERAAGALDSAIRAFTGDAAAIARLEKAAGDLGIATSGP